MCAMLRTFDKQTDWPAVLQALQQAAEVHEAAGTDLRIDNLMLMPSENRWASDPALLLVAYDDEFPVGYLLGRLDSSPIDLFLDELHNPPIGWIYSIAVRADQQRGGVGRAVVEFFADLCRAAQLQRIGLRAYDGQSHAFFLALGGLTVDEPIEGSAAGVVLDLDSPGS